MPAQDMGSLTVKAELDSLPQLTAFVSEAAEKLGLDPTALLQLELVIEEAATNVMKFAYPEGDGEVTIWAGEDQQGQLLLEISDSGVPFNPLQEEAPDLEADLLDRPIGGLGIVLILKVMDKAEYFRVQGKNILRLSKAIKAQ